MSISKLNFVRSVFLSNPSFWDLTLELVTWAQCQLVDERNGTWLKEACVIVFIPTWKPFFPIAFGSIGLISTTTITPSIYLGNLALIASIIITRFMVDQHPFLLEALTQVDNNIFPFQQHLKVTCNLLPSPTRTCLFPFEQFIGQQMVQFQDSILEHLHHHTFSNMFFDRLFEIHCVRILSCSGLEVGIWLIIWLAFLTFQLSSPSFSIVLWMWLGLSHPSIISICHCMYTHPINAIGVHLLCHAHGNEYMGTHDVVCDTFVAIAQDVGFHVGWKQLHTLPSTMFHSSHWRVDIVLTKMELAQYFLLSLSIRHE